MRILLGLLLVSACRASALSLVDLETEPPGINCPSGGTAILVGLDDNKDGALQAGEVDSTAFVCNGEDGQDGGGLFGLVLEGSFTIQNELDLAAMAGVQTVTGNLTISAPGLSAVSLSDLLGVQGSLIVNSPGTTVLDLPALTSIGQDWTVLPSAALQTISAPSLLSVGNDAIIDQQAFSADSFLLLQNIDIASMQTVGHSLRIAGLPLLQDLAMPSLVTVVEDFSVSNDPLLPTCQAQTILDQLTTAPTSFDISGDDAAGVCP